MKLQKLNARGATHLIVPLIVIVMVGGVGSYLYAASHAATSNSGPIIGIASKCLDNYANKKADDNKIQLYTCNGTGSQQWAANTNGTIINANDDCLDVAAAGVSAWTPVDLYQCNGSVAQVWTVNAAKKTIMNPHSGLCLDDRAGNTGDGTQIQLYPCNGSAAEQWTVTTTAPANDNGSTSG
jgi:hypothetical protein